MPVSANDSGQLAVRDVADILHHKNKRHRNSIQRIQLHARRRVQCVRVRICICVLVRLGGGGRGGVERRRARKRERGAAAKFVGVIVAAAV